MGTQDVLNGRTKPQAALPREEAPAGFEIFAGVPAFPSAATQLLQLMDDPEVSQARVAGVVGSDPGLATDTLMIANSPLFGFTSNVLTVQHAVCLLGIERMGRLATTVVLRSYLKGLLGTQAVQGLWKHSLACSLIAAEIAPRVWIPRDQASTAGLLHDVGRIGMIAAYPGTLCPLLRREYKSIREVLLAEKEEIGMDHCEAGWWLAKTWAFPEALWEVSRRHHHDDHDETASLLSLVAFSCRLADALGFSATSCRDQLEPEAMLEQFPIYRNVVLGTDLVDLTTKVNMAVQSLS
jgi:putative nucleotidyltransferase with HDIG domain